MFLFLCTRTSNTLFYDNFLYKPASHRKNDNQWTEKQTLKKDDIFKTFLTSFAFSNSVARATITLFDNFIDSSCSWLLMYLKEYSEVKKSSEIYHFTYRTLPRHQQDARTKTDIKIKKFTNLDWSRWHSSSLCCSFWLQSISCWSFCTNKH